MNKLKITAAVLVMSVCLSACGKSEPKEQSKISEPDAVTEETVPEKNTDIKNEEVKPESDGVINPLTGESGFNERAVGKRPVAVMVSNVKAALPQYGIDEADIIYELPVEGGITRLMAVYADYTDVPDICSVRSCRYYYPLLAYGMDAIYCHWGTDKTIALDTLNSLYIDRFDGNDSSLGYGTLFVRDEYRAQYYDIEHTGCLKGSELAGAIENMGYRTEINDINKDGVFKFNPPDSPVTPQGEECLTAELDFSSGYYSTFEYNDEEDVYYKYHSGSPHNDGVTGNQLSFTNVFALETYVSTRDDGKLMDVGLESGDGYYISGGKAQSVTWSKDSASEPIRVYDESGDKITVNAGKSYIGFIDGDDVKIGG